MTRPDLADRAIFLALEPIPENLRRAEKELWAEFEAKRPLILGALLDAVAHGLRHLPDTRLEELPRMADFALWATACETATRGAFMRAYSGNRAEAVETVIEADPVATAIRRFMAGRGEWSGIASQLLSALSDMVGEKIAKAKGWPSDATRLSGHLRRVATPLRKAGIAVAFGKRKAEGRPIAITVVPPDSEGKTASSASSVSDPSPIKDLSMTLSEQSASGVNQLKSNRNDADDADDAETHIQVNFPSDTSEESPLAPDPGDGLDIPPFLRRPFPTQTAPSASNGLDLSRVEAPRRERLGPPAISSGPDDDMGGHLKMNSHVRRITKRKGSISECPDCAERRTGRRHRRPRAPQLQRRWPRTWSKPLLPPMR